MEHRFWKVRTFGYPRYFLLFGQRRSCFWADLSHSQESGIGQGGLQGTVVSVAQEKDLG